MEPIWNPNGTVYGSSTARGPARYLAGSGLAQERRRGLYSTVNVTGNLDALLPGLKANAIISFDSFEDFRFNQSARLEQFNYPYTRVMELNDVSEIQYTRYRDFRPLGNPSTSTANYAFNTNFRTGLAYANTFDKHTVNAQAFFRTFKNVTTDSFIFKKFSPIYTPHSKLGILLYLYSHNFFVCIHHLTFQ